MRISQVKLNHFRRFTDLEITELADTVRLVMLAGPNGCGKSSLFDAFNVWYQIQTNLGWTNTAGYYEKSTDLQLQIMQRVDIQVHGEENPRQKGAFYFRSAYRNDPEFNLSSLTRMGPVADEIRFRRMIEGDATVMKNYQRLASQAFEDVFFLDDASITIGQFRERVVGKLGEVLNRLFPGLILNTLGNPLENGTFRFNKGSSSHFEYLNLSGGEKAAFDLILDLIVKQRAFPNSIYCIDEPEAHMNTSLHGPLLHELYGLVPGQSQLWVATHSIGMMRQARELDAMAPGTVAFLDFGGFDFDQRAVIKPSRPTRAFWEKVLSVALDDLATLVAPSKVVICEGNPSGAKPGKNAEHDAKIYNAVFGDEFPDVKFIAGGNAKDVTSDRLGLATALTMVAPGISVQRLIDRDDHAPTDVSEFARTGVTCLGRRHLEAYIYDDEVLTALCTSVGRPDESEALLVAKRQAMDESVRQGYPSDDVKSAAGQIYIAAKSRLGLKASGNDQMAFARSTLAPLLKPGLAIYAELRRDVFGAA